MENTTTGNVTIDIDTTGESNPLLKSSSVKSPPIISTINYNSTLLPQSSNFTTLPHYTSAAYNSSNISRNNTILNSNSHQTLTLISDNSQRVERDFQK